MPHAVYVGHAGFTIIEVLIVLAIAGLILLIMFLSVPALQRSTRNSQRHSDAAFIASQRIVYDADNKTSIIAPPGGYDCSAPITSKLYCRYIAQGLSFYQLQNVTFHSNSSVQPTVVPTITAANQVLTDSFFKCNPTGTGAIISGSPFDMVILFAKETSNGVTTQCIDAGLAQNP